MKTRNVVVVVGLWAICMRWDRLKPSTSLH